MKKDSDKFSIGIDEAGRGPWAGPVFASIVILDKSQVRLLKDYGITDSKKLTEKKRSNLFEIIINNCIYYDIQFANSLEIDDIGIYQATQNVIKRLVENLDHVDIGLNNSIIKIDGVFPKISFRKYKLKCIIRGDQRFISIGAASILSKVARDKYMIELDKKYPEYQFAKHKGYGTKLHYDLLKKYGLSKEHRKSFAPIKSLVA